MTYIVDITKPPIPPPTRIMNDWFGILTETEESKQRTKEWSEYIAEYRNMKDIIK